MLALKRYITATLFLGTTVLLTGGLGFMSPELVNLAGLCLFIPLGFSFLPARGALKPTVANQVNTLSPLRNFFGASPRTINVIFVVTLGLSALLVLTQEGILKILSVSFFLVVAHLILEERSVHNTDLSIYLTTNFLFTIFLLFSAYLPYWDYILSVGAETLVSFFGQTVHRDINLNSTYLGLPNTILFALFQISVFVFSLQRKVKVLIGALFLLAATTILYITFWSFWAGAPWLMQFEAAGPFITPLDFRVVGFLINLIPTFLVLKYLPAQEIPSQSAHFQIKKEIVLVGLLVLAMLLSVWKPVGSHISNKIFLYDSGSFNRNKPVFGQYGFERIGMFGLLPDYLQAKGYQVQILKEITPESLRSVGTLVMINLDREFDTDRKTLIWNFVQNGGSLLILGDHTGHEQIRKPYNDLLKPVHIQFNFDSAIPLRNRWVNGYDFKPHSIFQDIKDNEIQIGVGASLSVVPPSRPILLGQNGFSDKGDLSNVRQGYLGDMKFAKDERIGDLILVAEASYGKGKVLVFGDTSTFQNGALAQSHRFLDNIFRWLSLNQTSSFYPYNFLLAIILIALFLSFWGIRLTQGIKPTLFYSLTFFFLFEIIAIYGRVDQKAFDRPEADWAIIDASHGERFSFDSASPNNLDGLAVNLIRNNFIPLYNKKPLAPQIGRCKVLVLVAPLIPFGNEELKGIKKWVVNGGLVILAVGWEESEPSKTLLNEFGLRVVNIPLGKIKPSAGESGPALWNAWPLTWKSGARVEILQKGWEHPTILFQKEGKGGLLVAGDSSFLLNKNLEGIYNFNEGNIFFLKRCLERFQKGWLING